MSIMLITHAMGVVAETAQRGRDVRRQGGRRSQRGRVVRARAPRTQGLIRSIPRIDKAATHKVRLEAMPASCPS